MRPEQTEFSIGGEIRPHPLSPAGLRDLLIRPKRYFSTISEFSPGVMFICAALMGIAGSISRVEKRLAQAELGRTSASWETTASWLLSSWINYWIIVVAAGLVGAWLLWYVGGWWYKLRLEWSGATKPSASLARRVYTMQDLVVSGPIVLITLLQTALFPNFGSAWEAEEIWSSSPVIFMFWSCWTSYAAVTTAFQVSITRARVWFLILPMVTYIFSLGLVGIIFFMLAGDGS